MAMSNEGEASSRSLAQSMKATRAEESEAESGDGDQRAEALGAKDAEVEDAAQGIMSLGKCPLLCTSLPLFLV